MMYLTPTTKHFQTLDPNLFGFIATPRSSRHPVKKWGARWAGDNGAFTKQFDENQFFTWLAEMHPWKDNCLFVTCPDVVADARATLAKFDIFSDRIRDMGFPVGFVAQDDQENLPFPAQFDALFIGGSTEWKMGKPALECINRARDLGKWVHIGRVNSFKRLVHFQLAGADSVDGTMVIYAPDIRIKQLKRWMPNITLWRGEI